MADRKSNDAGSESSNNQNEVEVDLIIKVEPVGKLP